MNLSGKSILVSHAADAIGAEIADYLREQGAAVVGVHPAGSNAPSADEAMLLYDASDPDAIARVVADCEARVGALDAAVLPSRAQARIPFLEQTPEDWDLALSTITAEMFYLGQAVARQMVAAGTAGRIVYVSSVISEMPFHEMSLAGTALAAVNTIARVAALELGEHGISVNVVAPAWMQSGAGDALYFGGDVFPNMSDSDRDYIAKGTPLRRAATIAEVAGLCAYLISDGGGYVSGAYLPIDGAYAITKSEGNTPYPGGQRWMPLASGYDPRMSDT